MNPWNILPNLTVIYVGTNFYCLTRSSYVSLFEQVVDCKEAFIVILLTHMLYTVIVIVILPWLLATKTLRAFDILSFNAWFVPT